MLLTAVNETGNSSGVNFVCFIQQCFYGNKSQKIDGFWLLNELCDGFYSYLI